MMIFLFRILICILLLQITANAQNGNYNAGARSRSLANTSLTISDAFASYNNVAALAPQEGISIGFFSAMFYGIPGLFTIGLALNSPIFKGTATLNFYRFGDDLFNEHKVGLGYSHKIRFVRLGLQINYIQYKIESYGSKGLLVLEFGGLVQIFPELLFAAYIFNPTQSDPYHEKSGFLPVLLKTGISYRPVANLMLNIEYQHYLFTKRSLSIGMEYLIRGKFSLRTGISLWTLRSTYGIGFNTLRLNFNYAVDIHPLLGLSHEFSVTLNLIKQ
jgi:hypothetical protein